MRLRTFLLTGDTKAVADGVARNLGIGEVEAGLLPEDKLVRIKELVERGRVVAMLGDGSNDAPALTEPTVGVAMGSGTDVAREGADIVLLGNDLVRFRRHGRDRQAHAAHQPGRISWARSWSTRSASCSRVSAS